MKIAIIGAKGTVGHTLVKFFGHRHEVLCVGLDTELTLEDAARVADVVFIVTMPIEGVATLFARAANVMRLGTLLIHGTSIENPLAPHNIDTELATKNGITVCHCHFHFKPESPLTRTLFGQNISISITGSKQEEWNAWLEDEFVPFQPLLHRLDPGKHDSRTFISQLVHAVATALIGAVWQKHPLPAVQLGIDIGGPPCRLLTRAILRTAAQPKVMSSILLNHPLALALIEFLEQSLSDLKKHIINKNVVSLETMLSAPRDIPEKEKLKAWDESTSQIVRFEADMQRTVATFHFPEEKNKPGLLEKILHEFGSRKIDMTSTIAQNTPDGGCIITIGVKKNNRAVQQAIRAVNGWM